MSARVMLTPKGARMLKRRERQQKAALQRAGKTTKQLGARVVRIRVPVVPC